MASDGAQLTIRPERGEDIQHIFTLTERAFAGKVYADGTEPLVNDQLRDAGALELSLVAEQDGTIVGHVAFSPVDILGDKGQFYGLGPVSVAPQKQKTGIGSNLIRRGLSSLEEKGARAIVLIGDPNYYARFGFVVSDQLTYKGEASPYLQVLTLRGTPPRGEVSFHSAFGDQT